jgi:hypothetical protein
MYAGTNRRRLAFFIDVVTTISDEGMAIGHHVGPEVAAIDMANCDSAAVAIEGPGFAGNVAFANEGVQVRCCSSGGPSISARLARFGRVEARAALYSPIRLAAPLIACHQRVLDLSQSTTSTLERAAMSCGRGACEGLGLQGPRRSRPASTLRTAEYQR